MSVDQNIMLKDADLLAGMLEKAAPLIWAPGKPP